jgi:hypothetical protein
VIWAVITSDGKLVDPSPSRKPSAWSKWVANRKHGGVEGARENETRAPSKDGGRVYTEPDPESKMEIPVHWKIDEI